MLITPYVPNVVNAAHPEEILNRPSLPKAQRDITVYFRGKCTPQTERYIGKKMRHALVRNSSSHCYSSQREDLPSLEQTRVIESGQ